MFLPAARNLRARCSGGSLYSRPNFVAAVPRSGRFALMIWVEWIVTAALVVTADQLSKAFVLARWPLAASGARRSLVSIRCILNRQGTLAALVGTPALTVLWALMVMLAALILHYGWLGYQAFAAVGIGAA